MADSQLTDAQITNWRKALVAMIGPYALIMPADQIQAFRDRLQAEMNAEEVKGDG